MSSKEPVTTRRQRAYSKQEQEKIRQIYMGLGIIGALVVVLLALGFFYSYVIQPNSTITKVNNTELTLQQYQDRVRYERFLIDEQLGQIISEITRLREEGNDQFLQFYEQLGNQLQQQRFLVDQQSLDQMVEETLLAEKASADNVTVSEEDITEAINRFLAGRTGGVTEASASETVTALVNATATAAEWTPTPTRTPLPTIEGSEELTPTATPANTPTPGPTATLNVIGTGELSNQYTSWLETLQTNADIDEATYRQYIKASVLREKMRDVISAEAPTTGEQSNARHILISFEHFQTPTPEPVEGEEPVELTEEERAEEAEIAHQETKQLADEIIGRLEAGEDFAELAEEYSDDPGSRFNGGELGFVTSGTFVESVDKAVFELPLNEVSEPIESQFGWHIIEVLERGDRELSPSDYEQVQRDTFSEWLADLQSDANVEDFWTPDKAPPETRR
ncbi:peptidylprolyl isomerase [Anaerolineales bacterium HSG25]|nr:peptidylprolyl isomerase [Anaerolineales bacterium HSG25]